LTALPLASWSPFLFAAFDTKKRTGPENRADAQRWEVFDDWGAGIDPAPSAVVS
jgi:hypothetical protein